jgi:hypothetical protein
VATRTPSVQAIVRATSLASQIATSIASSVHAALLQMHVPAFLQQTLAPVGPALQVDDSVNPALFA